ncbi:MAG: 50S ribosomal protein L4 [Anaerolineales bacterium]|nr:MAG: 50S ribosomal protein L4 [Anaerolineales bacterium]
MIAAVYNAKGTKVDEVELRPDIFEARVNVPLMHQALMRQLANARQGTHSTKSRGEVARTKAKVYRQKGTGQARHGSRNAPLFVGGGIAHGPKPRSYAKKMPRKMRRAAVRSALSAKAREEQIVLVDALEMKAPKTQALTKILKALRAKERVLILLPERNEAVEKAASNLPSVTAVRANYVNVRDLLGCDRVVIPVGALQMIESNLGK